MQATSDDAWSPRSSDFSCFSNSSHPSDADDELDDNMSQASGVERGGSISGGDGESESGRNSPSPSVYSYHSSVDGNMMLRDLHGRTFNNTSEVGRRWFLRSWKHRHADHSMDVCL